MGASRNAGQLRWLPKNIDRARVAVAQATLVPSDAGQQAPKEVGVKNPAEENALLSGQSKTMPLRLRSRHVLALRSLL